MPASAIALIAASLPVPVPLTKTSTLLTPYPIADFAQSEATTCPA